MLPSACSARGVRSIISSNLDKVLIRIIHVKSWSRTSGARFNSRTVVVTDRVVRVAIWDSLCFDPGECAIKGRARQSESKMFIPASAPWRQLQSEVVVNSDYREWSVLTFQLKAQYVDV